MTAYPFPDDFPRSATYQAKAAGRDIPALQTQRGAFLNFGVVGPVEIEITPTKVPAAVVVRPLAAEIKARVDSGKIRFTLPRPMNLSVELDGNLDDPLFVFADDPLPAPPDRSDPTVHYFEGGKIHEAGEIVLLDGETLFLEGWAIVRAVVRAHHGANIRIGGAGILDASTRNRKINMLVLRECRDSVLEYIILLDPIGWTIHVRACEDIEIRNTGVIGWRANSEGLDIEHSSRIQVRGCF